MGVPVKERLVFAHVLEGLYFKALKGRVTDRLQQRLRDEVKVDLSKKLEPAYSQDAWTKALDLTAQEIFPGLSTEAGIEKMGETLTRGYFETLIGGALAGVLKVLGPARALKRMDRSLRSGNNYSEVRATELGPGRFSFWCNEVGLLRFNILGVLRAGAEISGAKNLKTVITHADDEGVTIDLSWDP